MTRDGVTEGEARQRIATQMPTEDKVRRATYVIRTDGTFEDTARQVRNVYNQLVAEP
jgi:dephospho-CoA kinase